MSRVLRYLGGALGALLLLLLILLGYAYFRPNRARVVDALGIEHWAAVSDGAHNSNTDLIYWRGAFYLVHASSPWHFASEKCRLVLWRSEDARHWERLAELNVPGEDIRDPKFAPIGGRLFLYALKNVVFTAEPYTTVLSVSDDGRQWTPFQEVEPKGWLFWRPKTRDGTVWYVPAYWHEHGRSILLQSTDGYHWETVSTIYDGERNDEVDVEFLPDGRMLATARLEGSGSIFGDPTASTLIAVAAPPYTEWTYHRSRVTRLDGPALFSYNGQVYAVGRYQPQPWGPLTELGSVLSRKRTALFRVDEDRLTWLSDLPSAGDTSYAGTVIRGDFLYVSYYTSDICRDVPWLLGMVLPSDIRIARIPLAALEGISR